MDWILSTFLEAEAKKCKESPLLKDKAYLGQDRENVLRSSISRGLRDNMLFGKALPSVKALFSLFGKDKIGRFSALAHEVFQVRSFQ